MRGVISSLHMVGSFWLSQVLKPLLVRWHMVQGAWVDKPYIVWVGGASRVGGCHRIRSMSHYKHSSTIIVVGIWGEVGKLSACESRFTFLLLTFCLIVADFVTMSELSYLGSRSHLLPCLHLKLWYQFVKKRIVNPQERNMLKISNRKHTTKQKVQCTQIDVETLKLEKNHGRTKASL